MTGPKGLLDSMIETARRLRAWSESGPLFPLRRLAISPRAVSQSPDEVPRQGEAQRRGKRNALGVVETRSVLP